MAMLILFLQILAWCGLIIGGLVTVLRIIAAAQYSSLDKAVDDINGIRRTFPVAVPGAVFLISAAFLIASLMS